jgi:hypothetical protein
MGDLSLSTNNPWRKPQFRFCSQLPYLNPGSSFFRQLIFQFGGRQNSIDIFYGHRLPDSLPRTIARTSGATVFADLVALPRSKKSRKSQKSNFAVTGRYVYDEQVTDIAASLRPVCPQSPGFPPNRSI